MSGSNKSKTPIKQKPRSASFKHPKRNEAKESEKSTHGPLRQPAAVASSSSSGGGYRIARSLSMKEPPRKGANVSNIEIKFSSIDITELRADVIVCPVSSRLRYDGGIAGEVIKKAGPGLKRALADISSRRRPPLPAGEAFVTGSFTLKNCNHIIHVVVPKFSEYESEYKCSLDLKKAFDSSFEQLCEVKSRAPAGKGTVRSIGVPTLGAGGNDIPKDVVARVLCRSVKEFLRKSNIVVRELGLQFIYIVSLDEQMLSILEDTWIAEDDALTRDKAAGGEGLQGQAEGRERQIGSDIRMFSGNSRPSDHVDSRSDVPGKICSRSVFYSHQPSAAQPSEYRTVNSTFFFPPGERDDQSRDGKNGAIPRHSGTSYQDVTRAASKPTTFTDDSDDETDELYAIASQRNYEPSASASSHYDSKGNYKSSSSPHTPPGVEDSCPVCLEDLEGETKAIPICGHKVCGECWKGLQTCNPVCPVCRKVYGMLKGNQPKNARMTSKIDPSIHLPGYDSFSTIVIDYRVPDGIQTDEHPNPGKPYKGTSRRAYLPDNREGAKIHDLLKKAFDARLIFTVGQSVSSGVEDVVTWNDIHHKTHISGPRFGYPDSSYLTRVKEELESKGIK